MGALFDGVCFGSNAEALDAYYGGAPVAKQAGVTSYLGYFEKSGGVWNWVTSEVDGSVVTTSSVAAPVPTFPACDQMASFDDGMALGWKFVLLLVVAWGIVVVRRHIR